MGMQKTQTGLETGKEIGILLNPLETGFETGRTTSLTIPAETRIYNNCFDNEGVFGVQKITISQKSFGEWAIPESGVNFRNKYIFSEEITEGKKFHIFSKPFEFPFKVSDLIYLTTAEKIYCFSGDIPDDIIEELSGLQQENLKTENCPENSINVCFSSEQECDIMVNYNAGIVEKGDEEIYFSGDTLMYAAIFSDTGIYNCQLNRLMQRVKQLSLLYKNKADFISQRGCYSNLNSDLAVLENSAGTFSGNLGSISALAEEIKDKNDMANCKLW